MTSDSSDARIAGDWKVTNSVRSRHIRFNESGSEYDLISDATNKKVGEAIQVKHGWIVAYTDMKGDEHLMAVPSRRLGRQFVNGLYKGLGITWTSCPGGHMASVAGDEVATVTKPKGSGFSGNLGKVKASARTMQGLIESLLDAS